MFESIDELVSVPVLALNGFTARTASGDIQRVSLGGLASQSTFEKTFQRLKLSLLTRGCWDIVDVRLEGLDHHERLERVLASLSDAQFNMLVWIMASSPVPRLHYYLGICAMVPRDVDVLIRFETQRPSGRFMLPRPADSPVALRTTPISDAPAVGSGGMLQGQHLRWNSVYISFSIDDVDGAADLLVKTMRARPSNNIGHLQRFAILSLIVSKQLRHKWARKWPTEWKEIDSLTLDLRKAFAPDGVYLATAEWLQNLNRFRTAAPIVCRILAPTEYLRTQAYYALQLFAENAYGCYIICLNH